MYGLKKLLFFCILLQSPTWNCTRINGDERTLPEVAKAGAEYLADALLENGQFVYRVNMNPDITLKPGYNILRHAGSIYALCQYHEIFPSSHIQSTIVSSGSYLRDSALAPLRRNSDLKAIWSYPMVNKKGDPKQAKLGGSGIGLLALCSVEHIVPGFTRKEDLRALGEFILYMQKEDGSFYSKYIPSQGGRNDRWTSLYYPGEACLGLLKLHDLDPDPRWLNGAYQGLQYLANKRKGQKDVPADHWALLATAKLLEKKGDAEFRVNESKLLRHALQITENILHEQYLIEPIDLRFGGFSSDGRTTPTATRLEGLLAIVKILPAQHPKKKEILEAVSLGIDFLSRAQISKGKYFGGTPRVIGLAEENPQDGNFNSRATEIRIDYVQHSLSAFLQFHALEN